MEVIPGIDPHPSEIAHRIAAEAILTYLLDQHLLDRGYRVVVGPNNENVQTQWHKTMKRIESWRIEPPS
jgi:hypothetical protein